MANILLVEPGYRNKYPPLGLMKIASYHRQKGDYIRFIKGEDHTAAYREWDRVYITTLFSFEWPRISRSIDFVLKLAPANRVFVGGIAASLMHERFLSHEPWRGVRFVKGLLGLSPPVSLGLGPGELYADDTDAVPIEDMIPDYSILEQIDYRYPVSDAYFTYASRGCVRKCQFCGVPKLEGPQRDTNSLTHVVEGIARESGEKRDLILMDNNVVASPNFRDIISEIVDLGFERDAVLRRGRSRHKRRVDFNQGVDARILCKDPAFLKNMAKIAIKPLRIAFDHLGVKKPYAKAVEYAADAGIADLSNYMLYNFHDSPDDLFERMHLNIELNERLGVKIFSFPMRYQPVTRPDRGHIGERWNSYYLRSMQLILQATRGIVSGQPDYFRFAFGSDVEEFKRILLMPHHYIFNRSYYHERIDPFRNAMSKLTDDERGQLLEYLCETEKSKYGERISTLATGHLRDAAGYFIPISHNEERAIWRARKHGDGGTGAVPEEERVEDAFLTDEDFQPRLPGI